MRYPADHRAKTRERILAAAATVFRRQGFQAASVDTIMAEAGLTAGGFYAHFKSKEELFAAAFRHALDQASLLKTLLPADAPAAETSDPREGTNQLRNMAGRYLSLAHRRMIDRGCPLPPLLADLPRQDAATRQTFQTVLEQAAAGLQIKMSETGDDKANHTASERPLALLALLVGGLTLSRAVEDASAAERILAACRELIDSALLAPTAGPPAARPLKSAKQSRKSAASPKPRKPGRSRS